MTVEGAHRAVVYARISVSTERSVSVERQIKSGRAYAEARGWTVAGEFVDDGVSASKVKPGDREGWRALLNSEQEFSRVVIWKVDRLSRKVLDFLNADEALRGRGASLVAVDDPLDLSTAQGRLFAQILAAFGEAEAAAISARVSASRKHLRSVGRVVGGRLPFGWTSERREDGGLYLVHDPERIRFVREAAAMVLEGKTVGAVCRWLQAEGAPVPPSVNRKIEGAWHHSTVANLLRNPVLCGMTLDNPGNDTKQRGNEVRRGPDGLPMVDSSIAIMSPSEHRRLVAHIDARERPRTEQSSTSPLLSRLASCGECDRIMHRTRKRGREALVCPTCSQTVGAPQLVAYLEQRLLSERGSLRIWEHRETTPDTGDLTEIEHAIRETVQRMAEDDGDDAALIERLRALKQARQQARIAPVGRTWWMTANTVAEAWQNAKDDIERREVLAGQVERLAIHRGRVGRLLDLSRVHLAWQHEVPSDAVVLPDGTVLTSLRKVEDGEISKISKVGPIVLRISDREQLVATPR